MATSDSLLPTPTVNGNHNRKGASKRSGNELATALTSSQADSLVSLFPPQAEDEARKMTAISGQRCFELYGKQVLPGSWARMLAASLLGTEAWYSSRCVLTWKLKGTSSARSLFQLSPSTRPIEEIESGLLPTPRVSEAEGEPVTNVEMSKNGSYSRVNQKGVRFGVKVKDVLAMLPTPSAREKCNVGNSKPRDNVESLVELGATKGQTGQKTGLRLQPGFALWMMGYPTDWLDLKDGEMPLSKARAMPSSRK